MDKIKQGLRAFIADDEGAQIIEYALIVAVVSLGLIALLMPASNGLNFQGFITRVNECLTNGTCSGAPAAPPASGT
jgi:pilus assembly protein Flp/PilA